MESKSFERGKAAARLWKVNLDTKGKVLAKIEEIRKAYKNYVLECHLMNLQGKNVESTKDFYLGSIDEMKGWL